MVEEVAVDLDVDDQGLPMGIDAARFRLDSEFEFVG